MKLFISILIYLQFFGVFYFLAFNSMLPYILIVLVLAVYSFDSVEMFKANFITYWVKKLTTVTNIYVLELALFFMHSKRLEFFKLQCNLIVLLNLLYNNLKNITHLALDSSYKKFIITNFFKTYILSFENFNYYNDMEVSDASAIEENEKCESNLNLDDEYTYNSPTDDRDFDEYNDVEASLKKYKLRIHQQAHKAALEALIVHYAFDFNKKPITSLNNTAQIYSANEIVANLAIQFARTDYELEILEEKNFKKYISTEYDGSAHVYSYADNTMMLYLLVMEIISYYQYLKKTNKGLEEFNSLKEIGFDKIAIKAPYFYDLNTDTFLVDTKTSLFYKMRLDQAFEAHEAYYGYKIYGDYDRLLKILDEDWYNSIIMNIASEIEDINARYYALKDASTR